MSEDFEWSQINIETAERNPRFYLALITADGVQRLHLVSAAKTYLNSSPADEWLFVFGPRAQTRGLSPFQRVPAGHLLELCDILDRLDGVELKPSVRLALLTLAHYDNQGFLDLVARIGNPIVLKLIADWHHEDPALSRHLARSAHPFVATRGVHSHLAYLRMLESYAGSAVRDLDPFGETPIDVQPAIRHRREIEQEIHDLLRSVFEKLGGAGMRSEILGEALARSLFARPTEKGIIDWQTLQVIARIAAQSIAADPAAAEVGILKGLQADPARGIAGAELVAAELGTHPALAREWRRHLLAHLDKRLQVPPREAFEAPQSSETDPLVPNDLTGESVYIDCAARALGSLASDASFDLGEWFKKQFRALGLLGERRDCAYSQWSQATSSRAAFLMLVGVRLVQVFPAFGGQLCEILRGELAERMEEWEWHKRVGYQASLANAIEREAVRQLGRLLPDSHLAAAVDRVRSVWAALLLAGRRENLQRLLETALRHNLEPDLLVLDQATLIEVIWSFAELGMWDELTRTVKRYRQAISTSNSGWSRTADGGSVHVLEALQVVQTDKPKGIALLRGLCEGFERTQARDAASIGAYLMVLRLLRIHVPEDCEIERKLTNADSFYGLLVRA